MGNEINVEQMKEFLEFRLDKVEGKVDVLVISLDKANEKSTASDELHSLALEKLAGKVNVVFKVAGSLVAVAGLVFAVLSYVKG